MLDKSSNHCTRDDIHSTDCYNSLICRENFDFAKITFEKRSRRYIPNSKFIISLIHPIFPTNESSRKSPSACRTDKRNQKKRKREREQKWKEIKRQRCNRELQRQDNHRVNSRGIAWINRPGPFIKS